MHFFLVTEKLLLVAPRADRNPLDGEAVIALFALSELSSPAFVDELRLELQAVAKNFIDGVALVEPLVQATASSGVPARNSSGKPCPRAQVAPAGQGIRGVALAFSP